MAVLRLAGEVNAVLEHLEDAFVAVRTGARDVHWGNGGVDVAGRQDSVRGVAVGAGRADDQTAGRERLAVDAVLVVLHHGKWRAC